jgi:hypothetical protein
VEIVAPDANVLAMTLGVGIVDGHYPVVIVDLVEEGNLDGRDRGRTGGGSLDVWTSVLGSLDGPVGKHTVDRLRIVFGVSFDV